MLYCGKPNCSQYIAPIATCNERCSVDQINSCPFLARAYSGGKVDVLRRFILELREYQPTDIYSSKELLAIRYLLEKAKHVSEKHKKIAKRLAES